MPVQAHVIEHRVAVQQFPRKVETSRGMQGFGEVVGAAQVGEADEY
jgi:hypothetical protein